MDAPALISRKLDALPDAPGVYLWKDARGEILYVGKANSLRDRVRSYFGPEEPRSPEQVALLEQVTDLVEGVVDGPGHVGELGDDRGASGEARTHGRSTHEAAARGEVPAKAASRVERARDFA